MTGAISRKTVFDVDTRGTGDCDERARGPRLRGRAIEISRRDRETSNTSLHTQLPLDGDSGGWEIAQLLFSGVSPILPYSTLVPSIMASFKKDVLVK